MKEPETIWRVTEDDIKTTIADQYPDLPSHKINMVIAAAHRHFSIEDWKDYVEAFVDLEVADLEDIDDEDIDFD
jgi:hypothetical protein